MRHLWIPLALLTACDAAPSEPAALDTDVTDTDPTDTDGFDTYAEPVGPDGPDTDPPDTDAPPDSDAPDTDPSGPAPDDTDAPDTDAEVPVDTAPACIDLDADGYGVDCPSGPDCDDASRSCNVDCADLDADLTPECAQLPGSAVLLYNGLGGGTWDIFEEDLAALYAGIGTQADTSSTVPADLADDYGLLMVLSPTYGFPDAAPARALLLRGGTVVVSVEHGGYGRPLDATAWLAAIGSTMTSVLDSRGGSNDLTVTPVPGVTDGVTALRLFYSGALTVGDGLALGVYDTGDPAIGWEPVANGHVMLVPDGSFFGISLNDRDNRTLLENLAP